MARQTEITAADIIDPETYAASRKKRRAEMIARKKNRRLAAGPNATMHFENFETMLYQIQEMLHAEKGGPEQLADELEAYNPLIPQGGELVGTFMLEYPNADTRTEILLGLTGIEETIALDIDGQRIPADWENDVDRTTPDGKTSAIHFLHFRLSPGQVTQFQDPAVTVNFVISHTNYSHSAGITGAVRNDLMTDL